MRRVPLLSGSRVVLVPVGDEDVVLAATPPPTRVVDAARRTRRPPVSAVRTASRVPRSARRLGRRSSSSRRAPAARRAGGSAAGGARRGRRRARAVRRARRAPDDPRRRRARATSRADAELERFSLARRRARSVASVVVHDATDDDLVPILEHDGRPPSRSPARSSRPTSSSSSRRPRRSSHGGAGTLLAACDAGRFGRRGRERRSCRPPERRTGVRGSAVEAALSDEGRPDSASRSCSTIRA